MDISLSSAGSLCVAVVAFLFFVGQAWLFTRQTALNWNAWGAALSGCVAVYSFSGFVQYNVPPGPVNRACELIQYTCMIGLLHSVYGFSFAFLERPGRGYHRWALPTHALLLVLLWFTPLFVGTDGVSRTFLWLSRPYLEPRQGPLGGLLMAYIAVASLALVWLWVRHRRGRDATPFFVGFCLWAVLAIHDALATLGMPTIQFLMQYGYLGFAASILSLTAQAYAGVHAEVRRHAEEARRERDRLEATLLAMADGCIALDGQGRIVLINAAAERLFGCPSAASVGAPLGERLAGLDPEGRAALEGLVDAVLGEGTAGAMAEGLSLRTREGETVSLSETHAPIHDGTGAIVGAVLVFRDITAQRRAEEALRESERRYKLLIDNTRDIIYTLDPQGRFSFVSPAWTTLLGHDLGDVRDHAFHPFVHPEDVALCEAFLTGVLQGRQGPSSVAYRVRHADGSWRWHTTSAAAVVEADGSPAFVGVARDITELKEMEAKLAQAAKMEAVGTLAGGIAHNFNNLLMTIQGHVSLLRLSLDPAHRHYGGLQAIETQVERAAELTAQLLAFARGGRYQVQPTDLNALIERTAVLFGESRREITIHRRLQPGLWTVDTDRGQMEQMLMHLYLNALQAMPGGGEILVETGNVVLAEQRARVHDVRPGRFVRVAVSDTGVGMDDKTLARIFDPFFTTKRMGRGTGLGLAMVYGIVRGHGGLIEVESRPGQGSAFFIHLPVAEGQPAAPAPLTGTLQRGSETVLLVDDEPAVLAVGRALLEALGYRVHVASSGQEALAVLLEKRGEIDLAVLDMVMPGLSGGETYDRLQAARPGLPVLLASGYSLDGQAQAILDRGCKAFIQKPFRLEVLSRKLREVLTERVH